jgi:hypothetical protein
MNLPLCRDSNSAASPLSCSFVRVDAYPGREGHASNILLLVNVPQYLVAAKSYSNSFGVKQTQEYRQRRSIPDNRMFTGSTPRI